MNEKGERLMFGLFHKKEQKALELGAPVSGQAVPLQEVSDPTFGGEILGKGTDGTGKYPADRGGKTHGWQDLRAGGWGDYLVI